MMWTRKRFLEAIDRHVTGVNDPYAPFNRDDGYRGCCDRCPVDECLEPCPTLIAIWEEEQRAHKLADRALYRCWLMDLSHDEAIKCDDAVLMDWVGLRNIGLVVEEGPQ